MSMARAGNGSAIIAAVACLALALAAWQWRAQVFQTERQAVDQEAWGGIKDEFPLPDESRPAIIGLAPAAIDAASQANPFSPMRRHAPETATGPEAGGGQAAPAQ